MAEFERGTAATRGESTQFSVPDIETLAAQLHAVLRDATKAHDSLGSSGGTVVATNRFGENSLKCDVDCEAAVLNCLEKAGLHGKAITEEHGVVQIGSRSDFTFVIDGIDGTFQYKKGPGNPACRYGTMVAVLEGTAPRFGDYLVTGIAEHARNQCYIAKRGGGSWRLSSDKIERIRLLPCESLSRVKLAYNDRYWEINRAVFDDQLTGIAIDNQTSTAWHYAALLDGDAQLVLECTRKSNLELATSYALVREAGGVTLTMEGRDVGLLEYFELMRHTGKQETLIACSTRALADEVMERCRSGWQRFVPAEQ